MARTPKVVEDRREQIIDAAMHVFAQKGFIRATNKDIAREAGITAGLIYHYFENKEAVLRAVIESRSPLQVFRSLPPEALLLPPEQFFRMVLKMVLAVVESEQFVKLIRLFLPEVLHNSELTPIATNTIEQAISHLEQYLTSKVQTGELRQVDTKLAAQTFVSMMIGFVLRRQILRDPIALQYTHEQIIDTITDTMLSGLLPR